MKKKLNYDYCQAAPVLEWMSQKWALVVMLRIEEYEKESIRFSELFRTFPQVSRDRGQVRVLPFDMTSVALPLMLRLAHTETPLKPSYLLRNLRRASPSLVRATMAGG